MTDTSPEMDYIYAQMWEKIPGVERLRAGCEMFSTAKALATAGILNEIGGENPKALRRHLFLRFYATDFIPEECERIIFHRESKLDKDFKP